MIVWKLFSELMWCHKGSCVCWNSGQDRLTKSCSQNSSCTILFFTLRYLCPCSISSSCSRLSQLFHNSDGVVMGHRKILVFLRVVLIFDVYLYCWCLLKIIYCRRCWLLSHWNLIFFICCLLNIRRFITCLLFFCFCLSDDFFCDWTN